MIKINVKKVSKKQGSYNRGGREVPYTKFGLLSTDDVWYGAFEKDYQAVCEFNNVKEINENDIVEFEVTESVAKNGQVYKNATAPSVQSQINDLKLEIKRLKAIAEAGGLFENKNAKIDKVTEKPNGDKDIEIGFEEQEDIPF